MLHPAGTSQQGHGGPARPLLRTTLGAVLRRTRLDQGRTLADVAGAARVSMQYLSELERGRKEASSEILAALCDALEVELPDVLAEVGRDLADALDQRACVLRLGTGPDWRAAAARPGTRGPDGGAADAVCLLAA